MSVQFKVMNNRDNDLQLLRLLFATLVWVAHSYAICYAPEPWIGNSYSMATFGVFGFFTISGYLITASYLNLNSVKKYFVNRFLRVFPALFMSVTLGLLLALLTVPHIKLNPDLYHSAFKYLIGNATLLDIRPSSIEGAFLENRIHIINASLWTLPLEFRLYIFVAFLGCLDLLNKRVMLVLVVLFCVGDFVALKNTLLLNIVEPSQGQSVYSVLWTSPNIVDIFQCPICCCSN